MSETERAPRVTMVIGLAVLSVAGLISLLWAAFWVAVHRTLCAAGSLAPACVGDGWVYAVLLLIANAAILTGYVRWCRAQRDVGPAVFGVLLGLVLYAGLIVVTFLTG